MAKRRGFRYPSRIPIPAVRLPEGGFVTPMASIRRFAVALAACALAVDAHAARVAILSNAWAAQTAADFNAKIVEHVFTGIDVSSKVPPLDVLLANYDAVLLFEDTVFVNATVVGNRVAEFANAGHGVVLGTFYDQDRSDATVGSTLPHGWGALEAIDPNTTDGVGTAYAVRTLAPASIVPHPLTSGVSTLAALRGSPGPYAGGNQAKPGTTVVAAWAQPNARGGIDPAIAYRVTGNACVIHVGIAPQYAVLPKFNTYGVDFAGDFYRAFANAFEFAASDCKASPIVPGDLGQIARGFASRGDLDTWRTGFDFAIVLDGALVQGGFGPSLRLQTLPDGGIGPG